MGGGTSIWASPDYKKDPREIFNKRLLLLALTTACAGCAYGFDQGNIGGVLTFPAFRSTFGYDELSAQAADEREGVVAGMLSAGGAGGALIAAPLADFLGRKYAIAIMSTVFIIGAALQEVPILDAMYVGRFLAGLAIGATSMLSPQFLAENSPKSIRGTLTTSYNLMIIMALALAFWINYGISRWPEEQFKTNRSWQLSLGIQMIPAGFVMISIWFLLETPRALIARGKDEEGLKNLCKLRQLPAEHPYVQQEYNEIVAQTESEQGSARSFNYIAVFKSLAGSATNRRRFLLSMLLFLFQKLTGTDALNYFAPQIFTMIGVPAGSSSLLTVGVYGIVKLTATIIYVSFIVDRVGRRIPLLVGGTIQGCAMLYMGLYLRFGNVEAGAGTNAGGIVGIIFIQLYAIGWSFGYSVAPYVVTAEIFPTRIRSVGMSLCFCFKWLVTYGITSAVPHMMRNLGYGTFLFFGCSTLFGVCVFYVILPELKGRSLESMDDLFERPLYKMWKHAYPTEEEKVYHTTNPVFEEKEGFEHVTNVETRKGADV
ncbi:quinate permease [Emericellopsis atlantica]|uniref:Quinate permease n=1 Tax=Emericellopsis atlantica TaxID=2614577 RepID=A0A9P7ZQP8_9HYPO|nr:quinate permease [Emericellopsis atlantica]KAG9256579.1 quinate permease [Emericellopsis atlantica]